MTCYYLNNLYRYVYAILIINYLYLHVIDIDDDWQAIVYES